MAVFFGAARLGRALRRGGLLGLLELGFAARRQLGFDRRHQGRGRGLLRLGAGALQPRGVIMQDRQRGVLHGRQFGDVHEVVPCYCLRPLGLPGRMVEPSAGAPRTSGHGNAARRARRELQRTLYGDVDVLPYGITWVRLPPPAGRAGRRRTLNRGAANPHLWPGRPRRPTDSRARKAPEEAIPAGRCIPRTMRQRGRPGRARDGLNRPAPAACRRAADTERDSYLDFLCRARADRADPARRARRELHHADADPGPGDPASARGPRPARLRPDRHRQDRRLRAADPAAPRRRSAPRRPQGLPRPRADPDPRARRSDRGQLRRLRPPPEAAPRRGLRRRRPEPAGPGAGARASTSWSPPPAACST